LLFYLILYYRNVICRHKGNNLPGDIAYKLYDTYGLNMETIHQLSEIESIEFDLNDFKEILEKVQVQSRNEANKQDSEIISDYSLNLLESANVPKTDDLPKYNYTYDNERYKFETLKCKLLGIVINGNFFRLILILILIMIITKINYYLLSSLLYRKLNI
jgi:alanyl-tRNA synthetase